jgi:hypothetical protein
MIGTVAKARVDRARHLAQRRTIGRLQKAADNFEPTKSQQEERRICVIGTFAIATLMLIGSCGFDVTAQAQSLIQSGGKVQTAGGA